MKIVVVLFTILAAGSYVQSTPVVTARQSRMDVLGVTCAACTVITGLTDQLAEVHGETYGKALQRFCNALPSPYSTLCGAFRLVFGSQITNLLTKGETPDSACVAMKLCKLPEDGQPMCHLYPTKLSKASPAAARAHLAQLVQEVSPGGTRADPRLDICGIPLLGNLICSYLNTQSFGLEYPDDDDDEDGFSDKFTLRGSAWRGKDCSDGNTNSYPGRQPAFNDNLVDTNCNGIYGVDQSNPGAVKNHEEELCGDSGAKGVVVLGDSVAANFHVPGEWFNASLVTKELYKNLSVIMENSLNWPHTSVYTGFQNVSWPGVLDGLTDSIYLRMRQRNRCNHRDYQNLGVNGATIPDANGQAKTLKRSPTKDKPAIVLFSFMGNDVCKYHPNPSEATVTTPYQARKGLLDTLETLSGKLAPGSSVVVVGIADARPYFAGIHDKIHPFGSLRKDVTYADFYKYLSCVDINPCRGWLTQDETVHTLTYERVVELNNVLQQTVQEVKGKYPNIEVVYMPNPIYEAVAYQESLGGHGWQLVEHFDGFHPNQQGHFILAKVAFEALEREYPHIPGPVNPNNDRIQQLFGDQGGH